MDKLFSKNNYGKNIDDLKLFIRKNLDSNKNILLLFNMLVDLLLS